MSGWEDVSWCGSFFMYEMEADQGKQEILKELTKYHLPSHVFLYLLLSQSTSVEAVYGPE